MKNLKTNVDLIINFKRNRGEIELRLLSGKVLISTLDFSFQGNLDDLLIAAVDKIMKRNRIGTLSLKTIKIEGNIDENSSAYKIALSFTKAWKEAKMVGF